MTAIPTAPELATATPRPVALATGEAPAGDGPLDRYYADRPLMWRNVGVISIGNLGWSVVFTIVAPLMQLQLNDAGLGESGLGLINSINAWTASLLVMYIAWKSDHCDWRMGRRLPFLLVSAPFIIVTVALFPFFEALWVLVLLTGVQMLAMDVKASTYPLLSIDCVRRDVLARANSVNAILLSLGGFVSLRYGAALADFDHRLPYLIGALMLAITTLMAVTLIREPPVRKVATTVFRPWSAVQVGWRDRRAIVLMLAVALGYSFTATYAAWVWLFAKNELGLDRSAIGASLAWAVLLGVALAYPIGWAIDRLGSFVVLIAFWSLSAATLLGLLLAEGAAGLTLVALLWTLGSPLYAAADMMVWKAVPAEDVGSVTSTNSFVRSMYVGALMLASGHVIEAFGYRAMFASAFAMTTLSMLLFFAYHRLIARGGALYGEAAVPPRHAPALGR